MAGGSGLIAPLSPSISVFSDERQEIVTYIVEDGDTPSAIAAQFGITVSTLLWANKLSEHSLIRPGQELIILPVSGVKHEVKRGETIQSIAKKYQAEIDDIVAFNDLPPSGDIFVGDTIIIPGGKVAPPPAPPSRRSYPRVTTTQVVSGYFMQPASGRNYGRLHAFNGVDIANSCGTNLVASAGGIVSVADGSGWNGGYGKLVRIRHANGVETLYGHMQAIAVRLGQSVAQGQFIGDMGTTGRSTGCHVHFEVRGARNPFAR
jgi:murein DD-endopeptidase MepM/ murein hydrolase activator NlpD